MNATDGNWNWNLTEFYVTDNNGTAWSNLWSSFSGGGDVWTEITRAENERFDAATATGDSLVAGLAGGGAQTTGATAAGNREDASSTVVPPTLRAVTAGLTKLSLGWENVSSVGPSSAAATFCANDTDDPLCFYDESRGVYRHSVGVTVVFCLAYFTVFVLGLLGNSFVVAVVLRSPRMKNTTNYFICNLALADILVIIFCLPATLLSNILIPWVLGLMMCKTVAYVQGMSVAASVYSLVAVSFDRFLAICYPLRCQITRARAKIVIIIIWMVALVLPIPWAIYFDLAEYDDTVVCFEFWPDPEAGKHYFLVANVLLCYIAPLVVISYSYVMIWVRVWSRNIPGETKGSLMDQMVQKSKVKVVKMLVVVVILFMLSWLPLYVIFTRMKVMGDEDSLTEWEGYLLELVTPIAQWLGSANSCINPILYAFFNKKYRKGFIAIVKSRRCCGKLGSQYNDELCSTISRTNFQKSRHWKTDNNGESRNTSGF